MKSRSIIREVAGHISAILRGILFIGISIQIILGMVWMCCNFSHVPQYGESLFYMQVSRTLRCDEHTGILYPLFLGAAGRNHYVVYTVQLAAAYLSAMRFLRVFRKRERWKLAWGGLAFVTMPLVMQCHMALLPCSLAASLLLLELALLAEAVICQEKRTLRRLSELALCWLALALLLPEYLFLGAVPVALYGIYFCRRWRGNRRMKFHALLLAAACVGMILGINSLTRTEGLYGKVRKTPLMILTQRISWSTVLQEYDNWFGLVEDVMDRGMILETARYADEMDRVFFPAVEQAVEDQSMTRQQAEECYLTLIRTAWESHKSMIAREMVWDMLAYGASPVCLQRFLWGKGYDTYSSRNYDFFLEHTPELSRRYMDYGCWWFAVAAVLTALLQALGLPGGSTVERRTAAGITACCLAMAGSMMLWYTMRGAGMQDYKNTALIGQLWTAWSVLVLFRG